MFNSKLILSVVLIISSYALTLSSTEIINEHLSGDDSETKAQQFNESLTETVKNLTEPIINANSTRTARTLLTNSRQPTFTLRRRQPIKIRSRADHFPMRPQRRRVYNGLPNAAPQPQQPQNVRFGYESLKSSKYVPSPKAANTPFFNNGKAGPYRSQQLSAHPNSIHVPAISQQFIHHFKASPTFNGQVVVHPVTQVQQKPPISTQDNNSYPKYVKPLQQLGNTVAPLAAGQMQQKQQQQKPSFIKYPDFKQYPIPDQEKLQKYNEQHDKYLQQQKYVTSNNPLAYYQMQQAQLQQHHQHQQYKTPTQRQELETQHQHQQNYAGQQHQYLPHQQQQQPSIPIHNTASSNNKQSITFPSAPIVPANMYAVHEENNEIQNNNYQNVSYQGLDKEAQEYLRFMNTNEYFLPKKDPNFKQIDEETNRGQNNNLKWNHEPQSYHTQNQVVSTYEQPLKASQYTNTLYSGDNTAGTSAAQSYNQGLPVSQLFYKQDPSTSVSDSSKVVRTSYQTGFKQKQFVVSSQDKNPSKYSIPAQASTSSTFYASSPSPVYSYVRLIPAGNRTPEPLRFEFTERDAMVGGVAYTHAPQAQLRYNSLAYNSATPTVINVESTTTNSIGSAHYSATPDYLKDKENIKPVVEENEDDPEDGDDMMEAGNNLYGRKSVLSSDSNTNKQSNSTTSAPPSEQKDTEDYCERICAIVEDENEEIICGSDGYMYTSEAQMECYASCLHIDVTIQSKGFCSAR